MLGRRTLLTRYARKRQLRTCSRRFSSAWRVFNASCGAHIILAPTTTSVMPQDAFSRYSNKLSNMLANRNPAMDIVTTHVAAPRTLKSRKLFHSRHAGQRTCQYVQTENVPGPKDRPRRRVPLDSLRSSGLRRPDETVSSPRATRGVRISGSLPPEEGSRQGDSERSF